MAKPINEVQEQFADLCAKGGGIKGGPARTKVQEVLRAGGQKLNTHAEHEIADALALCAGSSPWKVCFAMGLCWGHLAKLNDDYFKAAVGYLDTGSHADLVAASKHHNERGPMPIDQSLRGGKILFDKVVLPKTLSSSLSGMKQAQDRWLSPILSKDRPPYIGSWNGTAMFMIALFAQPTLGDELKEASVCCRQVARSSRPCLCCIRLAFWH